MVRSFSPTANKSSGSSLSAQEMPSQSEGKTQKRLNMIDDRQTAARKQTGENMEGFKASDVV